MGKKERQNKKPFLYMIAALIVTIVAFLVMPRIINFIASYIYISLKQNPIMTMMIGVEKS